MAFATATTTPFGTANAGLGNTGSFSFGTSTATTTAPTTAFGATNTQNTTFGGTGGFGSFGNPAAATTTAPAAPFGTSSAPSTGFGGFPSLGTSTATSAPTTTFGTANTQSSGFGVTSGFSFGTPTATSAPTTSAFGAMPGQKSGFGGTSGFSFSAPTTSATSNLFGQANKPSTFSFGSAMPNVNNMTKENRDRMIWELLVQADQEARRPEQISLDQRHEPTNVWQALALLKAWWNPESPLCRFRYYFYNKVNPQEVHLYQKPPNHDPKAWDDAQKANPDPTCMVPTLAVGFGDVMKRMDAQAKQAEAHEAKLNELDAKVKKIQQSSTVDATAKINEYKQKHMELSQRVVRILKQAMVLGHKGQSITQEEEEIRARFENLQDQVRRSEQFHGKLSQMWAQLQWIKESGRKYGKIDGVDEWDAVRTEDMQEITKILEEQQRGIQHVIETLQKDAAEIETLSDIQHMR
ncbi:hypothetical protein EC973_009633 [Apophysomyces ossiformis]|uniref:Nucleoporin Nup54 alpha-helical domain-containing protein n=1 Tax=Apophysomyces ossiformis TaxID=679940 RepID=A0A8H7BLY3_9FUNG|nr:hypothetical protein EC973_009633 [Apophysomyces ossiformis]